MRGTTAADSDPVMMLLIIGAIAGIIFLVAAPLAFRHFMNKSRDRYKD